MQVWLPLNLSDTAPMRWDASWTLGPLAASTQPTVALTPRLDFAALVNGGHSPFPVPHDAYGPPLQYFASTWPWDSHQQFLHGIALWTALHTFEPLRFDSLYARLDRRADRCALCRRCGGVLVLDQAWGCGSFANGAEVRLKS